MKEFFSENLVLTLQRAESLNIFYGSQKNILWIDSAHFGCETRRRQARTAKPEFFISLSI